MEYKGLIQEVIHIKNLLLSHALCDDPAINDWVEMEGRKHIENSARGGASNVHSQSIKPTTSKKQARNIDGAGQIEKLWRNRNGIRKVSKLGDRLQSWNKHQMKLF
ncbi:hypothetical protein B0I35DRAFT_440898 [Stachybotrys elegans]|uniref:Uncharacterized protein n=1 Tax=Stachybotrys elegans TaxID=80388 RepID=A0A8K0SD88_9HYPO|nr:hypothetical protein B0I35DRAFT_440898 [Stachybotrys elegans]